MHPYCYTCNFGLVQLSATVYYKVYTHYQTVTILSCYLYGVIKQ